MIALSPRAVARLESYTPEWPLPKIFRLTKGGKIIEDIFAGATINTPSMLAVEDQLDALEWADSIGGLAALVSRSEANLTEIARWVEASDWAEFLAKDPQTLSSTSICIGIKDSWFQALDDQAKSALVKSIVSTLAKETVGYDIGSYRDAPPGFRIWGGGTVEQADIAALLPWLDWAYQDARGH
jgi:phosphoserine aminotransferase